MAAPDRSFYAGAHETHTIGVSAAAVTLDLPAPGTGMAHVIDSIWLYALGAMTVFNVNVQTAAAATIATAGGQVAAGEKNIHIPVNGPVVCSENDATKITLTATGATFVQLTVNCRKKPT